MNGARVTIGGVVVSAGYDGSALAAVDGINMDWGRASVWEATEPTALRMTIVDRAGTFMSDHARIGAPILVESLNPARVIFRGTLDRPTATRRRMMNPTLGGAETVWIVTLTAVCKLAQVNGAVLSGAATDGQREGAGGWNEAWVADHLTSLRNAGLAPGIVSSVEGVSNVAAGAINSPTLVARRVPGVAAERRLTCGELLARAYSMVPGGTPQYDPRTDAITIAESMPVQGARLTYAAGMVGLTLDGAGGHVVPASSVGVAGYTLDATPSDAITAIQVGHVYYGRHPDPNGAPRIEWVEGFREYRTSDYANGERRVVSLPATAMRLEPALFADANDPSGSTHGANRFSDWLGAQLVALAERTNGQVRLPRLIFDARRLPLPAAMEDVIYQTVQPDAAFYFAGSVFSAVPNVGPQFQMVGGTLRYQKGGWVQEAVMVTTGPAPFNSLTVGNVVTNPNVTLGQFAPYISLDDLGTIKEALT